MALGGGAAEQLGLLMNTTTFLCHCRVETHPDPSFSRQRVGDGELEALAVAGVGGGGALLEAKSSTMHHPLL